MRTRIWILWMAMLATMPLYAQLDNEPPPALGYGYSIINVSAGTTVYLVTEATFTAGTVTAYGNITARRVH